MPPTSPVRQPPTALSRQLPTAPGAVHPQCEPGLHKRHCVPTPLTPPRSQAKPVQLKTSAPGGAPRSPARPPYVGVQRLPAAKTSPAVIQRAASTGGEPPPEPTTTTPTPKKRVAKKTVKSNKRTLKDNFNYDRGDKIYGGGTYYKDVAEDIAQEKLNDSNSWPRITIQSFIQAVSAAINPNDKSIDPDPDPRSSSFVSFVHGGQDDSSSRYAERVTKQPATKLISRLSKAAVEYAVRAKYHVHFIMGKEFTSESVASKQHNSVTSRELRYIYRNWATLRQYVTFYDQSKWEECPPLWEKDPAPWDKYDECRRNKS